MAYELIIVAESPREFNARETKVLLMSFAMLLEEKKKHLLLVNNKIQFRIFGNSSVVLNEFC